SPTALPSPGREGLEKAVLLLQSPSSPRAGGCEAGEEGWGGEGPEAADTGSRFYDLPRQDSGAPLLPEMIRMSVMPTFLADIAVPLPLPDPLVYEVPANCAAQAVPGVRARVLVGKRRLTGMIVAVHH